MHFKEISDDLSSRLRIALNRAHLRRREKVFAIGFNKTGTTSLHALMASLGLKSYHGVKWRACDDIELLKAYDCFSDGTPDDLAKLDRLFPGARFILQVRDLESWVLSRLGHIDRMRKERPGYRTGGHWDTTEESVRSWIVTRNDYHLMVLQYFAERPDDLLIVNYVRDPEAGAKVCRFLGYPGRSPRPRKNSNPAGARPPRYQEMLANAAAGLGVPLEELKFDILCPTLVDPQLRGKFPTDSTEVTGAGSRGSLDGVPRTGMARSR